MHARIEQTDRFCQGEKIRKKKKMVCEGAINQYSLYLEEIYFPVFVWTKECEWGSGALWFGQLDACCNSVFRFLFLFFSDWPILYVCEVCNSIYSEVSIILKAFQKPDFITEKIRLVK